MVAPRRIIDLLFGAKDLARLEAISRSRTEPASWVERARILLDLSRRSVSLRSRRSDRCDPPDRAGGLARAVRFGVMAGLDDSPRPGNAPEITADAKTWLVSLVCRKAKEFGYPHELWTTRLLARPVRETAEAAGHPCMARIPQGTACHILASHTKCATIWSGVTRRSRAKC